MIIISRKSRNTDAGATKTKAAAAANCRRVPAYDWPGPPRAHRRVAPPATCGRARHPRAFGRRRSRSPSPPPPPPQRYRPRFEFFFSSPLVFLLGRRTGRPPCCTDSRTRNNNNNVNIALYTPHQMSSASSVRSRGRILDHNNNCGPGFCSGS